MARTIEPVGGNVRPNGAISAAPHKPRRMRRTKATLAALDGAIIDLASEYQPCTVRQAYYLAVTRYLCDKTEAGYDLVQRRVLALRRAGRIPYDWIADNGRSAYGRTRYSTATEYLTASASRYALDYWQNSTEAVQVWVESDSIANVVYDLVVNHYGLDIYPARGFSSETFLHTAGESIREDGRPTRLYVLSDFDPSGVSLAEDIVARLTEFAQPVPLNAQRLALDGNQVRAWNLPTHALKDRDSRARAFIEAHGAEACELEAVPPDTLRGLLGDALAQHMPPLTLREAKRTEAAHRHRLANTALGGTA
jgi:hypothetical protein